MAEDLKKLVLLTFVIFLLVKHLYQREAITTKKTERFLSEHYVEAFNRGQQNLPKQWAKLLCEVPLEFHTLQNTSVMLCSSHNLKNQDGKQFVEILHFSMIGTIALDHACSKDTPVTTLENVTVLNMLHKNLWPGYNNACVSFPKLKCCPEGVWIPPEELHFQIAPGSYLETNYSVLSKNSSHFMVCDAPSSNTGWSSSYATSEDEKASNSRIKYSFPAYCAITLYFISGSLRRHLIQTYFSDF